MNKETKQLYEEVQKAFNRVQVLLPEVDKQAASLGELIDAIYAFRECVKYLEDLRKDLNAKSDEMQAAAHIWLMSQGRKSWATDHCSAKTKSHRTFSTPGVRYKNPEMYDQLMSDLGIPAEVVEKDLVRPHWPGLQNLVAEYDAAGKPLPSWFDKEGTPKLEISVRKKKDVLE